jgi:LemA protein
MTFWIVLAIIAAVAVAAIVLYNRLVKARQMAAEGWSGIDVQLKRRADLVPNLVETVKGYAGHERTLFEQVTRLRSEVAALGDSDIADRGRLEGMMSAALGRLLALAEAYPNLTADGNFRVLQTELAALEDEIQMARRYYNGATRNLNVAVQSFPGNLVAGIFGFGTRDFFELEDAGDRAVPDVAFPDRQGRP